MDRDPPEKENVLSPEEVQRKTQVDFVKRRLDAAISEYPELASEILDAVEAVLDEKEEEEAQDEEDAQAEKEDQVFMEDLLREHVFSKQPKIEGERKVFDINDANLWKNFIETLFLSLYLS